MANLWNSSIAEIKRNLQGFGDVIRSAVIEYVLPYVYALKEWIAANRELIKVKIGEFIKNAVGFISNLFKVVTSVYKLIIKLSPVILGVVGAFAGFKIAATIIGGISTAMSIFSALTAASAVASGVAGTAATGAAVSAATATKAFTGLASAIGGSQIAMAGLIGIAVGGVIALWNVAKKANEKLQKVDPAVPGMGNYYNVNPRARRAAWEKYEAEHPDELTYNQRIEAARNAADVEENPMEKLEKLLEDAKKAIDELVKKADEEIDAIDGLNYNGSSTSPAALRWGAMGTQDFWEIARTGV
jgi:hypothetical protein